MSNYDWTPKVEKENQRPWYIALPLGIIVFLLQFAFIIVKGVFKIFFGVLLGAFFPNTTSFQSDRAEKMERKRWSRYHSGGDFYSPSDEM